MSFNRPMKPLCMLRSCFSKCGLLVCGLALISVSMMVGCGGDGRDSAVRELNKTNGKRLANVYYAYQSNNHWRGPRDKKDFQEYIAELPEKQLELLGIDVSKIDDLFVSERDGQPFRIRYRVRGGFDASAPVIFEAEGVEGVRIVNFTSMEAREVASVDEYDSLYDAKAQPSAGRGGDRTAMDAVTRQDVIDGAEVADDSTGDSK